MKTLMDATATTPLPTRGPTQALGRLLSGDGVFASADHLYQNAVFGRDSLEVAEDILGLYPEITKKIILTLARLQGTGINATTEEEPGRIHHEYRSLDLGDTKANPESLAILRKLADKWGGNDHGVTYYGTVDATPLFIRLVDHYCQKHGEQLLNETIINKDGHTITVKQSLQAAVSWLLFRLDQSPLGLLEFKRSNPQGIRNQVWKDSEEFYIHPDGSKITSPVASIEVQGLAYDALLSASNHLPEQREHLLTLAVIIQQRVLHDMWLPEENYFALGMDYDDTGKPRPIRTRTANPAELLDTGIFDNVPVLEKERYLSSIITTIFSSDFLTNAGIRSRALTHHNLLPFWDYHGTFVTWPKETYDIIKGLRRHGFAELAQVLEERLSYVMRMTDDYPEFIYVDEFGHLLLHHIEDHPGTETEHAIVYGNNRPTAVQAWTVSAILGIEYGAAPTAPALPWQQNLIENIVNQTPSLNTLKNNAKTRTYHLRHVLN